MITFRDNVLLTADTANEALYHWSLDGQLINTSPPVLGDAWALSENGEHIIRWMNGVLEAVHLLTGEVTRSASIEGPVEQIILCPSEMQRDRIAANDFILFSRNCVRVTDWTAEVRYDLRNAEFWSARWFGNGQMMVTGQSFQDVVYYGRGEVVARGAVHDTNTIYISDRVERPVTSSYIIDERPLWGEDVSRRVQTHSHRLGHGAGFIPTNRVGMPCFWGAELHDGPPLGRANTPPVVVLDSDTEWFIAGTGDGSVYQYENRYVADPRRVGGRTGSVVTHMLRGFVAAHDGPVTALAISGDDRLLASGGHDGVALILLEAMSDGVHTSPESIEAAASKGRVRNEALEATLRETSDEADSYLVYGDWLLEHGEPRGELVAVQYELSQVLPKDRELALRSREIQLLQRRAVAYRHESIETRWRWGFVEAAAARNTTRDEEFPSIVREFLLHPSTALLRRLTLHARAAGLEEVLRLLHGAPPIGSLQYLSLFGNNHDLTDLAQLFPRLETLYADQITSFGSGTYPFVRQLKLRAGAWDRNHRGRAVSTHVEALTRAMWPNLEALTLHHDEREPLAVDFASLQRLFAGAAVPQLAELRTDVVLDAVQMRALASSLLRRSLRVLDACVSVEGVMAFVKQPEFRSLTSVTLKLVESSAFRIEYFHKKAQECFGPHVTVKGHSRSE